MSNKLTKEEKLAMAMKVAAPNIKPTSASAGMERALLAEQRRMNECGEDVYKKFLNRDVWTIDESACLICGLDPYKNLKELPYGGFYFCRFNNKFKETVDLINSSIETGKLKHFKNLTNPYKFEPQTVIEWALKKNFDIPKALIEWYEKQPKLVEAIKQNEENLKADTDKISPRTILIFAANPSNETQLRLTEEVRDINEGLQRSKYREQFVLQQQWATRVRDLRRAMQEYNPTIVHFCGHGSGVQGIVLEDNDGKTQLVSAEALASFFKLFADEVKCVVLNACFSEIQAKEIVKYIPYVVGMSEGIGDKSAIEFAVAFYDSLAAGKDYEKAYEFGCSAIQLAGIDECFIPRFFKKIKG